MIREAKLLLFASLISLFACGGSLPHVRDVIDLAPPGHVQAVKTDGSIQITWEPSRHEDRPDFAGYNVYFSRKSLILASVKNLPPPIIVDKTQHQVVLQNLERSVTYFVHVRSRNNNGDISFPSLPELIIRTDSFF